jgi:hypothetical protein
MPAGPFLFQMGGAAITFDLTDVHKRKRFYGRARGKFAGIGDGLLKAQREPPLSNALNCTLLEMALIADLY